MLKKGGIIPQGIWMKDEWSANYFHWMTNCLPRLWIGLKSGDSDRVISPESYRYLKYVTESLEILNLRPSFYHSNENIWVENLILPPRTASFPNFNEKYTQQTRENLSLKTLSAPTKKVYVSRKFAPKRTTHNETEVELLMVKNGFEILYMEHLSFREQLRLMSTTKVLVSLHGAALTNMLFMQVGQIVVELRNRGDSKTQCYFNLASALGQKYYYTLNTAGVNDSIMSNFTIDLTALQKIIDQIEG
jgi:capsular polysaccharide biosynthesis protein